MEALIVLSFIVLVFVTLIASVNWFTHITMNQHHGKPYDWCTFKTFMREFNKYKNDPRLEFSKCFKDSIFLYDNYRRIVYLHASIIEFDGKCMILYPLSYIRYCIWKDNFTKHNHNNRQKGLWKR